MNNVYPLNKQEPNRQAKFRGWLVTYGVRLEDIGSRMGVTNQCVSLLFSEQRSMSRGYYAQLVEMGVPKRFIPKPTRKRRTPNQSAQAA